MRRPANPPPAYTGDPLQAVIRLCEIYMSFLAGGFFAAAATGSGGLGERALSLAAAAAAFAATASVARLRGVAAGKEAAWLALKAQLRSGSAQDPSGGSGTQSLAVLPGHAFPIAVGAAAFSAALLFAARAFSPFAATDTCSQGEIACGESARLAFFAASVAAFSAKTAFFEKSRRDVAARKLAKGPL